MNIPCVLSIAGTDPTAGAGIQADLKTISALNGYAATVITSLVAQNTQGVQEILHIDPKFVYTQLASVFNDLDIKAVKVGMIFGKEIITEVIKTFKEFKPPKIVIDPVMVAKSGDFLIDFATFEIYKKDFLPYAYLITPNIVEAEYLLDTKINSTMEMENSAILLGKQLQTNVLLKGGHLQQSQNSSDVLYDFHLNKTYWFEYERIETKNTHGTGCSLSSAIATFLALDYSLYDAVNAGTKYLHEAIQSSVNFNVGKGYGPLDHFYFLR